MTYAATTLTRDDTLLSLYPLMRRLARGQARTVPDYHDLCQEAALCFLEKWHTYDGVHFMLFARWMVSHARRRIHRQRPCTAAEVLVDEPPARDGGPSPTERAEADAARTGRVRRLHAAIAALPARRREIVTGRYGLDGGAPRVQRELAGGLGVTKQRVSQLEAAAIRQLAATLAHTTTQESNP
ncbi:sigma-70 family RNA polymerase sigma factor [bacterium]|nr:sigma-70 family RNA polymerase sigma factor [bacterium]